MVSIDVECNNIWLLVCKTLWQCRQWWVCKVNVWMGLTRSRDSKNLAIEDGPVRRVRTKYYLPSYYFSTLLLLRTVPPNNIGEARAYPRRYKKQKVAVKSLRADLSVPHTSMYLSLASNFDPIPARKVLTFSHITHKSPPSRSLSFYPVCLSGIWII